MTAAAIETPVRRLSILLLAAGIGMLGIVLGVPRFMAGFHLGPQDATMGEIAAGNPVPDFILARTAEGREAAFGWVRSGQTLSDLATLRLAKLAGAPAFSPERRSLAAEGIALQTRALALAPADAYGWTRLLQGLTAAAAPAAQVEKVLNMAISRAPNEPALVMVRVHVGMLYWEALDAATRARLDRQIRLAVLWEPTALARLARARFREDAVRAALAGHPHLMARFLYARAHAEDPR